VPGWAGLVGDGRKDDLMYFLGGTRKGGTGRGGEATGLTHGATRVFPMFTITPKNLCIGSRRDVVRSGGGGGQEAGMDLGFLGLGGHTRRKRTALCGLGGGFKDSISLSRPPPAAPTSLSCSPKTDPTNFLTARNHHARAWGGTLRGRLEERWRRGRWRYGVGGAKT